MDKKLFKKLNKIDGSNWLRDNCPSPVSFIGQKVEGKGIVDADYCVRLKLSDGWILCPIYVIWKGMLVRCYNEKALKTHPSYRGTTVCDEWLSFMTFRFWFIDNWKINTELDKDILSMLISNKTYSPDVCMFISRHLNVFTSSNAVLRGDHPLGVCAHKNGRFTCNCQDPSKKNPGYIGSFKTPEEAHQVWLTRKLEYAEYFKDELDAIRPDAYPALLEYIKRMK